MVGSFRPVSFRLNRTVAGGMDYMEKASTEAINKQQGHLTPVETFLAKLEEDCP